TLSSEGAAEKTTAVNISPEGGSKKFSTEGEAKNLNTAGATEKISPYVHTKVVNEQNDAMNGILVVEHVFNPQVVGVVVTELNEIEASLAVPLVARVTSTLAGNGIKDTAAALQVLSPVAGIPTSLVHKDLTPSIVPNFISNIEKVVGLQLNALSVNRNGDMKEILKAANHASPLIKELWIAAVLSLLVAIWKKRNAQRVIGGGGVIRGGGGLEVVVGGKPKKVTLKSFDGEVFEVEETVIVQSETIKHLIEDDCAYDSIPLPNMTGKDVIKGG
ncbi:hypothetical protein IFM89_004200, partial [Coptis chinensis]